jgi:hypothetical protein
MKADKVKLHQEEVADEGVLSGVEVEEDAEYSTSNPFNPDSISISSKVIALDTVLRRIKNQTIRLAPDFQRSFVWDKKRKGQLIESMILKIPLPMFYVAEDSNGIWEVVDGLQRLSTIRDFILGPDGDGKGDPLQGLEFWGELLKGKTFFELERDPKAVRIINNIMESELSFTIINPDTPETVKRNVFKRINTGGMRLSDQEIRHALYQGRSTKLLELLVNSKIFIKGTQGSVKDDRMAGRELILRFLAFNILGRENLKDGMDKFLSDAMMLINGETINEYVEVNFDIDEIVNKFHLGVLRSVELFGDHAFRNSWAPYRRAPVNKALFEVWINLLSSISENDFCCILKNKSEFLSGYRELLESGSFVDSISRHGGSYSGAKYRYEELNDLMESYRRDEKA